jgi:hypothetical protein
MLGLPTKSWLRPNLAMALYDHADQAAKKSNLFCHSERSEESLLGLNAGTERFLGAQRASE